MVVLGVWIKKDKKKETANDSEVDSVFDSSSLRLSSPGFSRRGQVYLPCSPLMDCAEPLLPYFEPPPCALCFGQSGSASCTKTPLWSAASPGFLLLYAPLLAEEKTEGTG